MGIVDVALSQEGTRENGTNNVKYNTWYYGHAVSGSKYPWCAVFVSWCADQAGCLSAIGGKTAAVSTLHSYFVGAGRFQPKGNGYKPQAGDIMIQKSAGASHTGIVVSSDSSKFYTIEGNTSDMVAQRSYSLNDAKLTGFGVPSYNSNPMTGSTPTFPGDDFDNTGSGGTNTGVTLGVGGYDYTSYTVKSGDTIESIAKKFGCTPAMIMFVNNLSSASVKPGQTLKIPTASGASKNGASGVGTITKSHTMSVTVSHPTIEIEFYTEQGMLATVSTTGISADKDVDNDVISCNTVRNMGQDCPTMNIVLVWRRDWYHILSSNDLVIVKMQRPPESKKTVFFGLIDDIRKATDFSSGQPKRSVQVTCRGFAKAFVNFDVGLIENVAIQPESGFFAGLMTLASQNSFDAIKTTLDGYVGKGVQYHFSNGKSLKSYFQYSGKAHSNERLMDYTSYTSYNGSLWNFIKELSNLPFNETYWEIVNGKPNMIHRPTPFNKSDWVNLPRIKITDDDIVSDSTGRSDLETYTVYTVNQTLLGEDTRNLYNPLWYPPFYNKYGINQLVVNTVYESTGDGGIKEFHEDLFNFNIKNNVFANGQIVVKGKAAYHVGERVIIESDSLEYYVESVTHNFNCYGTWTTTLGLTRGIEPENRFTPPWGCAEEMTAAVMNAIYQQTSGEKIDWTNLPEYVPPVSSTGNTSGSGSTGGNSSYPGGQGGTKVTNGTVSQNEKSCFQFLTGTMGLNAAAACGVLSNINSESSFNTGAIGDHGTSYGICQWHNSRKTAVQNYCKSHGYSIDSLQGQLEYMYIELQQSYGSTLSHLRGVPNTAEGAYSAASYWCIHFEVPADRYNVAVSRGNTAKNTYWPRYS